VEIQPQLVLLQKTLLNIEGLGRELDPNLDLWKTAKPFLERWMGEQVGWRGLIRRIRQEAPYWSTLLPQLPRLIHRALTEDRVQALKQELQQLRVEHKEQNKWLSIIAALLATMLALLILYTSSPAVLWPR
jgi:ubiquinone biosynthesis protein